MADENDIRYGLEADASQGIAEVRRLQIEVEKLTKGFNQLEFATNSAIKAAKSVKGKAAVVSNVSQALTQEDPKNDRWGTASRDATLRNRILKLESTQQNIEARWVEAVNKSFNRILNTTQDMIKARETEAIRRQQAFLKRMNDTDLLKATDRAKEYSDQRTRGRFGTEASSNAYKAQLKTKLEQDLTEVMDDALQGARRRRRSYGAEREKIQAGQTFDNPAWREAQLRIEAAKVAATIRRSQTPNLLEAEARATDFRSTQTLGRFGDSKTASAYKKQLVDRIEDDREDILNGALQESRRTRRRYQTQRELARNESTSNDPEWVAGQNARDSFNDNRVRRQGQIGVQREGWENRRASINSDGGADLMAIQTSVMVGYMALSGAISLARNLSTFVVQLDKEFAQFQAITNTTSKEMVQVKKDLIGVSEATKFTALEVAEAATILGQAGLSAQNVRESIEAITLLATASGSTLNEAVESVTSTLSIFNLQADQATNIANTFTAALNGSKLSMDKITLGLQYAGNTAAQFGVTYQELSASLGAMANSGIKSGSTLGTGMRMLLVSLTEPTKKFVAELENLGLTTDDVDVKAKGIMGVMKTLQSAGFGASEAYKSFEVRAASAFAALSNNLDLGFKLEESFIGSTAAVEANVTQMEAFANQADRLKSTVGTLAYNAMEPFLNMLTDGIRIVADFVSELNKFSGILPILSIGLAGVGTALGLKTLGALGKGLFKGLAGAETVAALAAITGGTNAVTAGASRASIALLAVRTALVANPFIAAAAAIAMVSTAFYVFANRTDEATKRLDAMKAASSRFKQDADTISQKISAIDQVIDNLSNRRLELGNNPDQLRLKIAEISEQFIELGSVVNLSTATVDDLIAALDNLKSASLGALITDLQSVSANNTLIIRQLESMRTGKLAKDSRVDLVDTARSQISYLASNDPAAMQRLMAASPNPNLNPASPLLMQDPAYRALAAQITAQSFNGTSGFSVGSEFSDLSNLVNDPGSLTAAQRQENWGQRQTRMQTLQSQIQTRMMDLDISKDANGGLTPAQETELKKLTDFLFVLTNLLNTSEPFVQNLMQQQQRERENTRLVGEQDAANRGKLVVDSGLPQVVRDDDELLGQWGNNFENIANDPTSTIEQRNQALEDYAASIEMMEQARQALIDKLRQDLIAAGSTLEQANAAIDEAQTPLLVRQMGVDTFIEKSREAIAKLQKKILEGQQKALSRRLKIDEARLDRADTKALVESGKALVLATMKEIEDLRIATYRNELKLTENVDEKARLTEEFNAGSEEAKEARQAVINSARESIRSIQATALNSQIEVIKAQEASLRAEIDKVNAQIDAAGAGVDFSGLMSSLTGMFSRLRKLAGLRVDLERQATAVSDGPGDFYDALYMSESGGKFNERNSLGYTGRGQFGNARLADYNRAKGTSLTLDQFRDSPETQRDVEGWHWKDIQNYIANSPGLQNALGTTINGTTIDTAAMMGMAHLGGSAGMERYVIGGGRSNVADANGTRMSDYAAKFSGRSVNYEAFDARDRGMTLTAQQEAEALAKEEREKRQQVQVKDAEYSTSLSDQEVQRLLAQGRANNNPAALQTLISTVSTAAESRMASELEKWDAEHSDGPGDPAGREKLVGDLQAGRNTDIQNAMEEWTRASTASLTEPLTKAQNELAAAQKNPNKFSGAEISALEQKVRDAEALETANQLAALDVQRVELVKQQAIAASDYGSEALATLDWNTRLAELDRQRLELQKELNITKAAEAGGSQNPDESYGSALGEWKKSQSTFINPDGSAVSEAKQMENLWGETLDGLSAGFSDFFSSLGQGFTSIGDSVKGLGLSVVKMLSDMTARALAFQTMMMISSKIPILGSIIGMAGTVPGAPMMAGGRVPIRAAAGRVIRGGIPGRDSVPVLAEPGEIMMRRSAVKAIGEDRLLSLNALGNRSIDPGVSMAPQDNKKNGTVNVWVVSPDQQPNQMGPNDVLAIVGDNIENRGSLRKLIKSVQMGG